jgi:hypothetical protein
LADDEAKHEMEKGPGEVAMKQNMAQGKEIEIRADEVSRFQ